MKILNWGIFLFIFGHVAFGFDAMFDDYHNWDQVYFGWAATAHAGWLIWIAIYFLVPPMKRKRLLVVCAYGVLVSVWEEWLSYKGLSYFNDTTTAIEVVISFIVLTYYNSLWLFPKFDMIAKKYFK